MIFWGALLALLWDQLTPLYRPSQFDRLFVRYADWVLRYFNAGTRAHGFLAWGVAALLPALLVGAAGVALRETFYLLGLAWGALVLYQCLGLRQLTVLAGLLKESLQAGDEQRVRGQLRDMGLATGDELSLADLNLLAVNQVLQLGLARVFGVLFWFVLLGPFGAVAYALSVPLAVRWRGDTDFRNCIAQVVEWMDWVPARLLVFCFAIVGNFDEAMLRWRGINAEKAPGNEAILREAGFGALGLDEAIPEPEYVAGAAALLKRTALLWLGLLGLLWLGGL